MGGPTHRRGGPPTRAHRQVAAERYTPYGQVGQDWRELERELAGFCEASCWCGMAMTLDLSGLKKRLLRRRYFEEYDGNMYAKVDFEDPRFCELIVRVLEHRFGGARCLRLDDNGITDLTCMAAPLVGLKARNKRCPLTSLSCLGKTYPPKGVAALKDLGLTSIALPLPEPDMLERLDERVFHEIPLLRAAMAPDGYLVDASAGAAGTGLPVRACSREDAVEFVMLKWLKQVLPTLTLINHAPAPAARQRRGEQDDMDAPMDAAVAALHAPPPQARGDRPVNVSDALLPTDLADLCQKPALTFPPTGGDFSFTPGVDRGMLSLTLTRLYDLMDRDVSGSLAAGYDEARVRLHFSSDVLFSITATAPRGEAEVCLDAAGKQWWQTCRATARQLRVAAAEYLAQQHHPAPRGNLPYGLPPTAAATAAAAPLLRHKDPIIREGSPALPIDRELSAAAKEAAAPSFGDCMTAAAQVMLAEASDTAEAARRGCHGEDHVGVRKTRAGSPVLQPSGGAAEPPPPRREVCLHLHHGPAALLTTYKKLVIPTSSHYLARSLATVDAAALAGSGYVSVTVRGALQLRHGVHALRVRFHDSIVMDGDMKVANLATHFY
eukprot:TRINITY_DN30078_c0_g1_i1.p1 TRINITY_DN30078_c0_g1~~TRINITY_DN30078_c0_g1_i1.p1  ORF type:complete len:608 (+),score=217.97 TRINITY_DN30078_c0_g1_i1:84-1907(+)